MEARIIVNKERALADGVYWKLDKIKFSIWNNTLH